MSDNLSKHLSKKQQEILDFLVEEEMIILSSYADEDVERLISYIESMEFVVEGKKSQRENRRSFTTPTHKLATILAVTTVNKLKLRNWLTRGQLNLHADAQHKKQGWRLFSTRDAIHIALVGKLSNLGVPISDINEIVDPILDVIEKLLSAPMGTGYLPVFVITNNNGWNLDRRCKWIGNAPIEDDPLPSACIYIDPIEITHEVMTGLGYDFQMVKPS